MARRRVVITGLGAVSGLGLGFGPLWEGLVAGRSAVGPITRLDASGFRCRLASEVRDLAAKDFVPKGYRKATKVMARDSELAVAAAKLAVEDAGIVTRAAALDGVEVHTTYPAERMGCQIGAGLIAAETEELTMALATAREAGERYGKTNGFSARAWGGVSEAQGAPQGGQGGMNNLQPLWMLKYLPNMLACHVTIIHGTEGPSNTITCAEASGLLSLGESARVIERDAADLCFSGGAESKVNHMGLLRQQLVGWLADTGDATDAASVVKPYAADSRGGVPGEAGAILVLEEREHALRRNARVYAEIVGFGASQSLHLPTPQLTTADPATLSGGLESAIRAALRDAVISADEVDAIVPLASGVPVLDALEARALRTIFGARIAQIPLVTTACSVGTCAAGEGALLAGVAAMCLKEQKLPARLHSGGCPADLLAAEATAKPVRLNNVLVCSTAMGGQNAALVLRAC